MAVAVVDQGGRLRGLRLSVELPPLPAAGTAGSTPAARWWEAADAALRAGARTLWLTGGPGAARGRPTCDPVVLAAAAGPSLPPAARIGVVSVVAGGRHPAVVAREVTTLDVLTGGRAAVMGRLSPPGVDAPGDAGEELEELAEWGAVCRAVLEDPDPVFEGRRFHVAGARNRPPPVQAGGMPVALEVPRGAAGALGKDAGLRRLLLGSCDAVVCNGTPGEVAAWREVLGEAGGSGGVELLCRVAVPGGRGRGREQQDVAARLDALHAAGAEGALLALGARRPPPAAAAAVLVGAAFGRGQNERGGRGRVGEEEERR